VRPTTASTTEPPAASNVGGRVDALLREPRIDDETAIVDDVLARALDGH